MIMSPELDLLDHLTGSDQPLSVALAIFERATTPDQALNRAARVVTLYVSNRLALLLDTTDDTDTEVPPWKLRVLLAARETWSNPAFVLRITPQGAQAFARDSAGFFDRLFSGDSPGAA